MSKPEYTLKDSFEIKGVWWLPQNPEKTISGILSFDGKGKIILDLIGSFTDLKSLGNMNYNETEAILGVSDNGFICTLINNLEINKKFNSPGILKSKYESRFLLFGKHFNSLEDIDLQSIQANYLNLESWLSSSPFSLTKPKNKENQEWTLSFKFPEEFKIYVNSLQTFVESIHDLRIKGDLIVDSKWTSNAYIKFSPDESHDFQWFLDRIYDFSNFLTLMVGKPIYLNSVKSIEAPQADKPGENIEIFFTQRDSYNLLVDRNDVLFSYPKISKDFHIIINSWFEKLEKLRSTFDLFFGTFYNPTMYSQFQFLSLMQSIESFHRATMDGKYLDDNSWEPHKNKLLKGIPTELEESFKSSLKSRLRYGNEYSLRKRIQELLNLFQEETVERLHLSKKYFTGLLVDTRNYLTHYDESMNEEVLDGENLYWGTIRLRILLFALLLKELGLAEKLITDSILESREYSFALTKKSTEQNAQH